MFRSCYLCRLWPDSRSKNKFNQWRTLFSFSNWYRSAAFLLISYRAMTSVLMWAFIIVKNGKRGAWLFLWSFSCLIIGEHLNHTRQAATASSRLWCDEIQFPLLVISQNVLFGLEITWYAIVNSTRLLLCGLIMRNRVTFYVANLRFWSNKNVTDVLKKYDCASDAVLI